MNDPAASGRSIKIRIYYISLQVAEYQPDIWQVKLIYPDTLRYRDYSLRFPLNGTGYETTSFSSFILPPINIGVNVLRF